MILVQQRIPGLIRSAFSVLSNIPSRVYCGQFERLVFVRRIHIHMSYSPLMRRVCVCVCVCVCVREDSWGHPALAVKEDMAVTVKVMGTGHSGPSAVTHRLLCTHCR